ncbi:MAG TPA: PLP-dependent aminotransferase family protein [Candidatus Monoglobus merdigallinarum]|uniref:PLP-dependent aminotransferase family protein n=1 Tax=Candidatus Monoglobus merdigallinarum TaxID=2838698 RepID=A0A9D1TMM2_9FIRM|nr:PLP-dependent aminotransferase family protein [Candidatus Monoglobus merdigallinarum]
MIYINFDRNSSEPLYIQAFNQLVVKINHGEIPYGTKLPSQRQLAQQLNVSVNTVSAAYNMLIRYEYISSRERSGYYVNKISPAESSPERVWHSNVPYIYNFSRNGVDLTIPSSLRRAYRYCAKSITEDKFTYPDYTGLYSVRKQISQMLSRLHGINCQPIQIILGPSIEQLTVSLLDVLGRDCVFGMENPAYFLIAQAVGLTGRRISYLNTKPNGISEDILKDYSADILFLMPFHHYPLYCTMTKEQKLAVLSWANKDKYIIEYGYDMDFVYQKPTEPLFSMSNNKNVIFAGDFKRTVSPSINLAYLVLPESLLNRWQKLYYVYHSSVSVMEQEFISEIIRDCSYYSNIKRLKNIYRKKRDALVSALKSHPAGNKIKIENDCCGTALLLRPQSTLSGEELIVMAHEHGVKLSYISNALEQKNPHMDPKMFILGFGELSETDIRDGAKLLLDTWGPYLS